MKFMDTSVRKLDMVCDRLELIKYAFKLPITLWVLLKSQACYDQNYHITLKIMLAQLDQA